MKVIKCYLLVLFPILNSFAQSPPTFSLAKYQGRYISTLYVRLLEETKSPILAADSAGRVDYQLKSTDSTFGPDEDVIYDLSRAKDHPHAYAYRTLFRFDESDVGSILRLGDPVDGFRQITDTDSLYERDKKFLKFSTIADDTFMICKTVYENGRVQLDTLQKENIHEVWLINRLVIAGHYATSKGDSITINEDGTGSWNKLRFEYRLGLDPEFLSINTFETRGEEGIPIGNKMLGFRIHGRTVDFFEVTENEAGFVNCSNANPVMSLIRLQP